MTDRLFAVDEWPDGLIYRADFISADEEAAIIEWARTVDMEPYVMHDTPSKRLIRQFGEHDAIPAELLSLRARGASLTTTAADSFVRALINYYPAGAGIGWHRDRPQYGDEVVGVSLGSDCPMRFRRIKASARTAIDVDLARRSVYVIGGESRWHWEHSITAAPADRWSITFRTLRTG